MQAFAINLWFDTQAKEAAEFYVSVFPNSRMGRMTYYTKEGFEFHHKPEGSVLTVEFVLNGTKYVNLNGGPQFKPNEAISFIVNCDTQEETDRMWEKLTEGGDPNAQACGWLKDKFGVSWQVVPAGFFELIGSPDKEMTARVLKEMFTMKKLDINVLRRAAQKK